MLLLRRQRRRGLVFEGFQLVEEAIGLSVGFAGSAFFGPPVVLVDVLELLLAFLGASLVPQLG